MTPNEVYLVLEAKRPKHVGGIHESDLKRLEARREEMAAKGVECL